MDISKEKLTEGWQGEYDAAIKDGGVVTEVMAEVGRLGGLRQRVRSARHLSAIDGLLLFLR